MTDQPGLDDIEFAENPDPRCPCVLLLDTSGSMQGKPIESLNLGLQRFRTEVTNDELASRRAEIAVVTFNDRVTVEREFATANSFDPPVLAAGGQTHMGHAIDVALDLVEARKAEYRKNGVDYYRPWIFMITDGAPQGEAEGVVEAAIARLRASESGKHVSFFAVAAEGADMETLKKLSVRPPLKLEGVKFVELFVWLSSSLAARTNSAIGDMVSLPPTSGWSQVEA